MIHYLKRTTLHLIFWSLITTAIGLSSIRLLLVGIDHYKLELSSLISEIIGSPVNIDRLTTRMSGLIPELVIKNIVIASYDNDVTPAIQLKEIRLKLNLLDLLSNQNLLSATEVTLVGAKLSIQRKIDGRFAIIGLKNNNKEPSWLLTGKRYQLLESDITFQDENFKNKIFQPTTINLVIANSDNKHSINAIIKLPEHDNDTLTLAMELEGNFLDSSHVNGKIFADLKQLKIAEIFNEYLPENIFLHSGISNARLWSQIKESELIDLKAELELKQLKISHQHRKDLPIQGLKTQFKWHKNITDIPPSLESFNWKLDVPYLMLINNTEPSENNAFSLTGTDSLHKLGLAIQNLDLQKAAIITEFFIPSDKDSEQLSQLEPHGQLNNFSSFIDLDQKHTAVNGKFNNVAFRQLANLPSINNFSGDISGSDLSGNIYFSSKQASIDYPAIFREKLIINELVGSVHWQQNDNQWVLSSPLLKLDLLNIYSKSRLNLTLPKKNTEQPFMDLQMSITGDDISQLKHYFPTKVMNPADTDWLDAAFISGRINQSKLLFYGSLGSLKSAVFEALFEGSDIELNYAPGWPHFLGLAGRVSFFQNMMICDANEGHAYNFNLLHATAINTAVGINKQLQVIGEAEGKLPDGLSFLQKTPLNTELGSLINAINTEGKTKLNLNLDLALSSEGYTKVDGRIELNDSRLRVQAIDLWINKINGLLKFTEKGVFSDFIKASTLNQPITIDIKNGNNKAIINATGKADIEDLKKQFVMPFWEQSKGSANYQLKLNLSLDNTMTDVALRSDLVGIELNFPGILAKPKQQSRPVLLDFKLNNPKILPISIDYNEQFKAAIQLNLNDQSLYSGHFLFGQGKVSQLKESGIILEINQNPLNLADLISYAGVQTPSTANAPRIMKLLIHSPETYFKDTPLGAFKLNLNLEGNYWLGHINSSFAVGKIQLPVNFDQDSKISLHMDSLDLAVLKQIKLQEQQQATAILPEKFPLLTIHSSQTRWHEFNLGTLILETERIPDGIGIKQLDLLGSEQKLILFGTWKSTLGIPITNLQGSLNMPRAGELLQKLDITKEFKETRGSINFSLNMNSPPYQFESNKLSGNIDIVLNNGRILSIEPGLGRVLGIIAMNQWIKRLQLDFRDIYEEGLTFDSIKGHFKILNGQAVTNDLIIDAIAAKISIIGKINFIDKVVDNVVNVTPKSADALPIAGTIMDNLMTLVTSTLTGKNSEGFFLGSQYHIQGHWDKLEIIPLHENDGLLQKTWTGISDFPWLKPSEK